MASVAKDQEGSGLDERVLLTWRSPERLFKARSREFYSTVVVLAVLLSIIMFFIEGVMPALVIWAFVFVVYATTKTPPAEADHELTSWGIRTGGKLYRFNQMILFWIEEKWGKSVLRIILTGFPGQLILLISKADEELIKKTLADNQITMQKPEPSSTDKAVKWLSEKIPLE